MPITNIEKAERDLIEVQYGMHFPPGNELRIAYDTAHAAWINARCKDPANRFRIDSPVITKKEA
jgi:hypothetical protein